MENSTCATGLLIRISFPRSEEDEAKTKNVWMKGHVGKYTFKLFRTVTRYSHLSLVSDIGAVSILWSQPVTALQILSPDGKWRYVKHVPNGIVRILPPGPRR